MKNLKKKYKEVVSIDLETTGLDVNTCKIIEIGAVKYNLKTRETETFHNLIKVDSIPKHITALTGIDRNTLECEAAEDEKIALASLLAFCGHESLLIGHNINRFDLPILNFALRKNRLKPLSSTRAWDTLSRFRKDHPGRKASLREVCNFYGLEHVENHRALGDAQSTLRVFKKQIKRCRNNKRLS